MCKHQLYNPLFRYKISSRKEQGISLLFPRFQQKPCARGLMIETGTYRIMILLYIRWDLSRYKVCTGRATVLASNQVCGWGKGNEQIAGLRSVVKNNSEFARDQMSLGCLYRSQVTLLSSMRLMTWRLGRERCCKAFGQESSKLF